MVENVISSDQTLDASFCTFFRKVTLLMVGLDNAGKTSTVADLTGGRKVKLHLIL